MFRTAYDTTACRNYVITKTIEEIEKGRLVAESQFSSPKNPFDEKKPNIWSVLTITPGLAVIPPFAHPIQKAQVSKVTDALNEPVYVDVRNFTRLTRENEVVVSGFLDYELAVMRGLLQGKWSTDNHIDLLNLGNYQITMYARWLSDILTKRLALPPEIQMTTTILAGYFYLCLFLDNEVDSLDEREKLRFATMLSKATYVNTEDTFKIIENWPVIKDVTQLIEFLKAEGGSSRFEDLTVAILFTAVSGSWFGSSSREIAAVALEHPPTFIAMITLASEERGYRNTVFGKLAQMYQKADEAKSFLFNLKQLYN